MKLFFILLLLFAPVSVFARSAGGGTHDYSLQEKYDCSVTPKPSKVKWVSGSRLDVKNDGIVILTWRDSFKTHTVEIDYNGKKMKTADDSKEKVKGLTNGVIYSFKVRGVSNCGKSGWSKTYKTQS